MNAPPPSRSSDQQLQANAQYEEFMRALQQPHTHTQTSAGAVAAAAPWSEGLDSAHAAAAASSTFTQIPAQRTAALPITSSKFTWKQKQAKMHSKQQEAVQRPFAPLELQPLHPTLAAHRPVTLIKFHSGGVQLPPTTTSRPAAASSSSAAAASSSAVAAAAASSSASASGPSPSAAAAPSPKRARVESSSKAATAARPSTSQPQAEAQRPHYSAPATAAASSAASSSAAAAAAAVVASIPAASSSFRSYCVLVRNVPGSFHTADLRHFFSDLVEAGRFRCFQPSHRRDQPEQALEITARADEGNAAADSRSSNFAAAAAASSAPPLTRRFERIPASISHPRRGRVSELVPWKVMVQLRKRADVQRLFADYQDREWVSHKGEQMGSCCRLRFVPLPKRMLRQTEKAQARASMDLTDEALDLTDTAAEGAAAAAESDVIDLTDDEPAAAAASSSSSSAAAAVAVAASSAADDESETADEISASREILAAYSAGEFQAPAFLPAGLVGTPSKTVLANLAHLPPSLVKRLALRPVVSSLAQSKFAFNYKDEAASSIPDADADDDDDRLQARSRARLAAELSTSEEWDRDLAQAGQTSTAWDSGRGQGKLGDQALFEEECDNPWDKGDASGLVHYTDAAREEAERGRDIDERNVDMWGVSDDDEEEEERKDGAKKQRAAAADKEHDSDAFSDEEFDDSPEGRARRKAEAASKMASRMSAAVAASSAAASAAAAASARAEQDRQTSWTQSSFLQRMMAKQGYTAGQGLGKKGQGIAQPIEAVNRGSKPVGLGFKHKPAAASAPAAVGSASDFARALQGKLKHKGSQQRWAAGQQAGGFLGQGRGGQYIAKKRRWEDLEKEQ